MPGKIARKLADTYYSLSIRKKITLSFTVALSLLLILLAVFTYRISSGILIGKAIENTAQHLRLVSEKLEIILDNAENYSKIAITNNTIQQFLALPQTSDPLEQYNRYTAVQSSLRDMVDVKTFVDSIVIYDGKKQIYDSGGVSGVQNISSEYFGKFAGSLYGLTWETTRTSNYLRQEYGRSLNIVSLFQKFNSAKSGSPLGIIQLSIDENYIADQYGNIDIGASSSIFIVNRDGTIASHRNKDLLYTSIDKDPYYEWAIGHEGGKVFRMNDKNVLVVSKPYNRLGWVIVGIVPIHEITKDNEVLTGQFFKLGVLFVLIAIVLTLLISASITRPLNRIRKTVKDVQEGNLDVWLDLKSRDEIGALAKEFNKMVANTKGLMERMVEEQKQKKEYELAVMQAQINPHFLYNTLESICALADLKRNADIVSVVNRLALFYRGVLSKGSPIISMEDEILITQTYLDILKVRYGDQLDYEIDCDPAVYEYETIKLLLQPLVENSVYHGLKNKRGKGRIRIESYPRDGQLIIVVSDDGIGMTPEKLESLFRTAEGDYKTKSFGLKSTDDRIKLYFGSEYGLTVESEAGVGTTITIRLPIREMRG